MDIEEREESRRYAATWEQAFINGLALFRQEALREAQDNAAILAAIRENPDLAQRSGYELCSYFADMLGHLKEALHIYREEMSEARAQALCRAAERVQALDAELAEAMRRNQPEYLTDW